MPEELPPITILQRTYRCSMCNIGQVVDNFGNFFEERICNNCQRQNTSLRNGRTVRRRFDGQNRGNN